MPIHYNANPLRKMIRKAASRRIDIAGIWNSEGTYVSWGWETGLFLALWQRFECYGSMALSFGASLDGDAAVDSSTGPNWGSGASDNYFRNFGNGTTWTETKAQRASATAANRGAFDVTGLTAGKWGPHFPMYHGGGSITGWVNFELKRFSTRENPLPIEDAFTVTFWGGEFTSGGGSVSAVWRYNGSTTIHSFGTVSYAGTNGVIKKSEASHSADASRAAGSSLQLHCQTVTANLFLTWIRFCRTNQTRGFAVHPFYSCGSQSIYDMWEQLLAFPSSSWNHYFDVLTNYQGADLAEHCAIFDIYEGSNFAGETSVSGSAPQPADADHPDNYVWYVEQIIIHIRSLWELSGRSLDNLVFRVRCSHPINNSGTEAEVETFRAKLRELDFTADYLRNVTVCDMKALKPLASMVADGDFYDDTHLSYAGYNRLEKKAVNSLLNTGGGRSRNRGRLLAGAR